MSERRAALRFTEISAIGSERLSARADTMMTRGVWSGGQAPRAHAILGLFIMGNEPKKPAPRAPNPTLAAPLWRSAYTDARCAATLDPLPPAPCPGAPVRVTPPAPTDVEAHRTDFFGPTYAALTTAFGDASLDDLTRAQAALGVVPALLIASAARPATDRVYRAIERIPDAVRRPFHKALGILIDSGLAAVTGAAQALLDTSMRGFAPGNPLPSRVELPIDSYSQLDTSCGETAAATILKAAGVPVLLDEIDTQLPGPYGVPGLSGMRDAGGNSLLIDREFARRGLTAISGVSDLARLKQFVASGMPVAVSLGWANGAGHYAVVSGFDEARGTVTVRNYKADGKTAAVPYAEFDTVWARHLRVMTAVSPRRDPRLAKLIAQGELRRPSEVARGFSLTDFWCDDKRLFIEGAYRYVTADTDATVRVSFNSEGIAWGDPAQMRWLNGSIAVRRRVADGWFVGFRVDKLSVRKQGDEWTSFRTTPIGASMTVSGPGFELSVAAERGGVQASLGMALAKRVSDLGLQVSVSASDDGRYSVTGVLAGTW